MPATRNLLNLWRMIGGMDAALGDDMRTTNFQLIEPRVLATVTGGRRHGMCFAAAAAATTTTQEAPPSRPNVDVIAATGAQGGQLIQQELQSQQA
jgi:hypothetical protein